ncbi:MAG TPA: peptidylprolyl isomerase [Bryobacteraceae bacterium]
MRLVLSLAVITGLSAWAQTQAPAPKPKAATPGAAKVVEAQIPAEAVLPITALPPATIIATIDGKKVTAGELQTVLRAMPAQVQQQAQSDRRRFLEQYGVLMHLADEARKAKLDEQSPYKEAIEYNTMQILYQAEINQKMQEMPVSSDDVKKTFETNKERYIQAKVKAIYLPFTNAPVTQTDAKGKKIPNEAEAKAKAEDLVKQIRAGGDFGALAKEHSGDPNSAQKGGDFGFIKKSDAIAADLKKAIFGTKPGEITDPVRQPNGFYIFRVDEIAPQSFEQVQGNIVTEMKNAQFVAWLNGMQKSLNIQMEHEVPTKTTGVPPASK